MITAYPKIFTIGTDYIRDIFDGEVEVTEKIDGSQFNFGKINGELQLRSKGAILYPDNPEKMFKEGIDYIVSIQDKLPDNVTFHSEYLKRPKHNVLKYDRVPQNHLALFGLIDTSQKCLTEILEQAEGIGIESVPVLYRGEIQSAEQLISLLDRESVLGGTKIEGVVVKNFNKPFLLGGQPIPVMAGKFVSEKFKETAKEKWGKEQTKGGHWLTFLESFKTEARWEKAIQHLRDNGQLENNPRDIGNLLREIQNDIAEEEKENIKNFLWNENKGDIFRYATKGFPEWYKNKIMEQSFEEQA